jgi:galactokinase
LIPTDLKKTIQSHPLNKNSLNKGSLQFGTGSNCGLFISHNQLFYETINNNKIFRLLESEKNDQESVWMKAYNDFAAELFAENTTAITSVMKEYYRLANIRKPEFAGWSRVEEYNVFRMRVPLWRKAITKRSAKKMYETNIGLSRKYEVSCAELDFLNDIARECGVSGSRVMGGGFGGCTINLVKNELYSGFIRRATESYEQKFKIKPKVYDVVIKDGARKLKYK